MNGDSGYIEHATAFAQKLQDPSLTMDDLCRILTLSTFPYTTPNSAALLSLNASGQISMIASFGLEPEYVKSRQNIPISADIPSTRVVRLNKVLWEDGSEQVSKKYSEWQAQLEVSDVTPNSPALVGVPIRRSGSPIGVLLIAGESLPISEDGIAFLELLSSLISLRYMVEQVRSVEKKGKPMRESDDAELTTREKLIQALMAKGRTNIQIAEELGFSDSTIRQDAMRLFAKLGVNNRIDAGKLWVET